MRAIWLIVEPFRSNAVVFLKAPENFMHIALAGVFPHIYQLAKEAQSFTPQLEKFV